MRNKNIKIVDIETRKDIEVIPPEKGTYMKPLKINAKDRAVHDAVHPWAKLPDFVPVNFSHGQIEKGEIRARARISVALKCPQHGWYPACNYTLFTTENHHKEGLSNVHKHIREITEKICKEAYETLPPPLSMRCPICNLPHLDYQQSLEYWNSLKRFGRNSNTGFELMFAFGILIACWMLTFGRYLLEYWKLIAIGYVFLCFLGYRIISRMETKKLEKNRDEYEKYFWSSYEVDYSGGKEAYEEVIASEASL